MDNAVVKVWLGLGTNTTRLGLGEDHGSGQDKLFVKVLQCGLVDHTGLYESTAGFVAFWVFI